MDITNSSIDGGRAFDWGRTSEDYARFRDIYPEEFYQRIADKGLCVRGQYVLDIGTGTGVLPRNMYRYGARWLGTDISENQIAQAQRLSEEAGMDIEYKALPAERLDALGGGFDVITACQCYWYFDHRTTAPLFAGLLKEGGRLVFLLMNWLPCEDEIALASEKLVLKYNPDWTGCGETFHPLALPEEYLSYFEAEESGEYRLPVRFTRESWNGRIKACRGIGASSLSEEEKAAWEREHSEMLSKYPEQFDIAHFAAYVILKKK